ncbi:MAG: malate synthase G [Roseovarius sp.]|nr:malate synthase G [Roseovarius sp.]
MMLENYVKRSDLMVAESLADFIEGEVLVGLSVSIDQFWRSYSSLISALEPENRRLLKKRYMLQTKIDRWHEDAGDTPFNLESYKSFLLQIGYLVPVGEDFKIATKNVDAELGKTAGPQLVVPVTNARFAINAANARWGSLYDAFYGTDAIPRNAVLAPRDEYNPLRGVAVVARVAEFLDQAIPLATGKHTEVTDYSVSENRLVVHLANGSNTALADQGQYLGYSKAMSQTTLLFIHNGLHIEIEIDRTHPIGTTSAAGVKDVVLESALSTIQDLEDSVATVDAEDKVQAYRNWLGLMKGDLVQEVIKNGKPFSRRLAADRTYTGSEPISLTGRSMMLVRNVGHLMTTDAVLSAKGAETPEGFLDAMITILCALHDVEKTQGPRNSRTGSIYIVKPKMHGPEEAALSDDLFNFVEDAFGLERHTVKIGIMDEERRTSVNLSETIRAVKDRVVFINTGFLDRTGDEIHTSMRLGPMVLKAQMKQQRWLAAYENNNVDVGLATGMSGGAQIGKGMWAQPDDMAAMLQEKVNHPQAGASTAWVPSPTAAVLHALHYHAENVAANQTQISKRTSASLDEILTPPVLKDRNLSESDVTRELHNNCQSILGYVVRWIDSGVGCSKVPDINNTPLMEDRATLRISAQHVANWLHHGICTEKDVRDALQSMAAKVDLQNSHDPNYVAMTDNLEENLAFRAASELIFKGVDQPSGYTEPILHHYRKLAKSARN